MKAPLSEPAAAPVENDWGSRSHVQTLVLMLATAAGVYLCFRLALPFLSALAWALALAVSFVGLQRWVESKVKHPTLAASISVCLIGLIVVVPATFVGQRLAVQVASGAELVTAKFSSGEWRRALESQPRLAPIARAMEKHLDIPGTVKEAATWLSATAGSIVKGSVVKLIGFCISFYLLFFFLRDRRSILHALRSLSPLAPGEMDKMLTRVGDTIYATIYGTLAAAAVQGILGGLMFWWLGLSAPLLWGVVMALLAIVPVLGAFIVWVPAALFLAVEGSWGKALILTLWGVFVVGTMDNLLLSALVGTRLKLHTVLAFLSVVGGLLFLGPAGLILGPIALTVTMVLVEIWAAKSSRGQGAARQPS